MRYISWVILMILLLVGASSFAHPSVDVARPQDDDHPTDSIQKTKIYLVRADKDMIYNEEQREVLHGDVVLRLDSSYLFCDSAYFFQVSMTLEAFGQVRMEQGDTLFVYGDYLFYDGNQDLAQLRNNARVVSIQQDSSEVILYTDSLDYDRAANICYYFEHGRIVDQENELVSIYGQYSPDTKIAVFNDSVRLNNPQFVLYSDTLEYSTETKVATILGPSIIESDSGIIHSSRGWYNTIDNTSELLDRSVVFTDTKSLVGDSLVYDKGVGIGKAYGNMSLCDTAQRMMLTGHYGYYEEFTEYAFATDSACAIDYSQGDSLYMYGDTLELIMIDSTSRILRAVHGVRFYRSDMQGVCDSMRFNTADSILYMYGKPILWSENQQLTGDSIIIYMRDSVIDYVHVPTSAFIVQEIDTGCFNQIGGDELKAFFLGKQLKHLDVDGSAETIYYPLNQDSTIDLLNYTLSSYLTMIFKVEGQMDSIKLIGSPSVETHPLFDVPQERKKLKKFVWHTDLRPVDKYDIFRFYIKKTPEVLMLPDSASIVSQDDAPEVPPDISEPIESPENAETLQEESRDKNL